MCIVQSEQEVKEVNKRNRSFVYFTLFRFNLCSTSLFILSQIRQKQGWNTKRTEDWPPSYKSIINDRWRDGSNFPQNRCCVCCYSNRSFVMKKVRKHEKTWKRSLFTQETSKKWRNLQPKVSMQFFNVSSKPLHLSVSVSQACCICFWAHISQHTLTVRLTLRSPEAFWCANLKESTNTTFSLLTPILIPANTKQS